MENIETEVAETPAQSQESDKANEPFEPLKLTTNFFSGISQLLPDKVNLTITIRRNAKSLVVGVRPQVENADEDNDDLKIRPLVLTHPAEDLDKGFFETVSTGVHKYKTFAEELGAFEEAMKAEKKEDKSEPPKKDAPATKSKPKKKSAPPKKAPPKPAPKPTPPPKPEPPKEPTPQEKAEALAKQADEKATAGEYSYALTLFQQAMKLYANPDWQGEIKRLEVIIFRKELEKDPSTYKQLEGYYTAANYGDLAKGMKAILARDPDNPKMGDLRQKLISTLGEGFVKQLLN